MNFSFSFEECQMISSGIRLKSYEEHISNKIPTLNIEQSGLKFQSGQGGFKPQFQIETF